MNVHQKTNNNRKGVALVETAILCLFLYVPVLMMVIVWGDLTLDKERAQAASAYTAFNRDTPANAELVDMFFPGATGVQDATDSIRNVGLLRKQTDSLQYYRPTSNWGDYTGSPSDHEYDLQYKLYSLGAGEFHVSRELQATDGGVGFVNRWEHWENYVAEYLTNNEIIESIDLPDDSGTIQPGDSISLTGATDSRDYTDYVDAITEIFNGALLNQINPTYISTSAIETKFRSPHLQRLEESPMGTQSQLQLPERISMRFAPSDSTYLSSPQDSSFWTGYSLLKNPNARPDPSNEVRQNLRQMSLSGALSDTENMFSGEEDDTTIDNMPPGISNDLNDSPDHEFLVNPGDPR